MNKILNAIEDMVSNMLSLADQSKIDNDLIKDAAIKASNIIFRMYNVRIGQEDIELISKKLEERFDITMTFGTLFSAETYKPWLDNEKGDIEWYYWDRYKRFLAKEKFPPQVIRSLDSITDQILDHLENPKKEGAWSRKGMVVGHVQSGKTANYTGLINKSADSGYKVIIVLAGVINSLRNQTQSRMDTGFIGKSLELKYPIGVGLINQSKQPASFTTRTQDFKKQIANQIGVRIEDIRRPVVFVIKKNKSTLENLIGWLKHNNPHQLKDFPMLLVDDEADYASINTNPESKEATTINIKIRELLNLFERSSYTGYTATPFANVFIDPDTEDEMLGEDLFPRDFIISLDPPSNYVGPEKIFSTEMDLNIVKKVDDYGNDLPLKHKKDWSPLNLPNSLKDAIMCFILCRAIRILRGQGNEHNSMMINVSRFTTVQTNVKLLVDAFLKEIRPSIINNFKLNEKEALKNKVMFKLRETWDKEYAQTDLSWKKIQDKLKDAVSPIGVIEVNSSSSAEPLSYDRKNFPDGRNVIVVGGLNLSRGLTLECLTVSYFLRKSIMYDTIMQMGRWFGYRDGYEDLCRIFMLPEALSWYSHISDVTKELKEEFRRMKSAELTPQDFGLCVRSHPESLIVTARNKMRTGKKVLRKISLEGRLVESTVLINKPEVVKDNLQLLDNIVGSMIKTSKYREIKKPYGFYWEKIPVNIIREFIGNFKYHPAAQVTNQSPLISYLELLQEKGIKTWDVVLISPKGEGRDSKIIQGLNVRLQMRTVTDYPGNGISINKERRRVGSAIQEAAGLHENAVKEAENVYKENNLNKLVSGKIYRKLRKNPLLIFHLLKCKDDKNSIFPNEILAYGISFPGEPGSGRPDNFVEYTVNTTWWQTEYFDYLEEEEVIDD